MSRCLCNRQPSLLVIIFASLAQRLIEASLDDFNSMRSFPRPTLQFSLGGLPFSHPRTIAIYQGGGKLPLGPGNFCIVSMLIDLFLQSCVLSHNALTLDLALQLNPA